MTKIHLFDFDGTITRHDSFTGFIRHVHGVAGLLRVLLVSAPAIIPVPYTHLRAHETKANIVFLLLLVNI